MKEDYIINSEPVVMMSVSNSCCRVVEKNDEFLVNLSLEKIIDNSCKYFGSSLEGRKASSKYHLKYDYKLPIIIDETRNILAFPTKSYKTVDNYVIFINNIKDYEKIEDGILLYFYNENTYIIKESYGIFENQYLKSQKLLNKYINIRKTSLI